MKNYNEEITEVLNDLIRINRDRISGYETAAENLDDADATLKTLFYQLSDESQKLNEELSVEVRAFGGEPAESTTLSGKIYRTWMDIKDAFSADDAKTALDLCEYGEDAAQKAYAEAIDASRDFPESVQSLIRNQRTILKASHDLIRHKRDAYREARERPQYHR